MSIGLILIGLITLVIGLALYFDALNVKPMYVKAYASIIGVVGVLLGIWGSFSHDKSSSEKSDKILITSQNVNEKSDTLLSVGQHTNDNTEILKEQNNDLIFTNRKLMKQLSMLQSENGELKTELNNTKDEVVKSVLGGDSFAVISFFTDVNTNLYKIQLYIQNFGDFPMYDVSITQNKYDISGKIIENHRTSVGNIAPKNLEILSDLFNRCYA